MLVAGGIDTLLALQVRTLHLCQACHTSQPAQRTHLLDSSTVNSWLASLLAL